jgi:hypothetical protein
VRYNFAESGSQYIPKINGESFTDIALELFCHQYENCEIYRQFSDTIGSSPEVVKDLTSLPFLPVSFFKTHEVVCNGDSPKLVFESSGTTAETPSRHFVYSPELYQASLLAGFRSFYGEPGGYAILALLPSYLERKNSSLVYMAKTLMEEGRHPSNGFYLDEWDKLHEVLQNLEQQGQPSILLGVTFALLDLAAAYPMELRTTIVMETGGMKGRKDELTRAQVHEQLKSSWQLEHVHSEYGMTELLSQAYARQNGRFYPSPSMRVFVRDLNDPLEITTTGTGLLNIIDLANTDSCAFVSTEDIGTVFEDGSFEVLGRIDHAVLRGCSLLAV